MWLSAQSKTLAEARLSGPELRSVVGGYELVFTCSGTVHAKSEKNAYWLLLHSARVLASFNGRQADLGHATLIRAYLLREQRHSRSFSFPVLVPLQPSQLMALENMRNGSDLSFEVRLHCESGINTPFRSDYLEEPIMNVAMARSDWAKQLKSAGALDVILLEIAMPASGGNAKQKAVLKYLRSAQELFLDCHYDDCVTKCRKAIEEAEAGSGAMPWARLKERIDRETLSKQERERVILGATHLYAHLSAHSESRKGTSYSRADARLMMELVVALLNHEL